MAVGERGRKRLKEEAESSHLQPQMKQREQIASWGRLYTSKPAHSDILPLTRLYLLKDP